MRFKAIPLLLAALLLGAPPLSAQQRDIKVPSGGISDALRSSDSTWRPDVYNLNGANVPVNAPNSTAASCRPVWNVTEVGECTSAGTQSTKLSDGCGGSSAGSQTCTPPIKGTWTYHGGPAGECQLFNTNGFAVCYLLLQCQDASNNNVLDEGKCEASRKPRWYGCAVNGNGVGTCDAAYAPRYDRWSQQSFIQPNCNFNGFNTATGYYTNSTGVCNSTITAVSGGAM